MLKYYHLHKLTQTVSAASPGSIPYPIDNVIAHYAGDSEHMPAQSKAFLKYATPSNH